MREVFKIVHEDKETGELMSAYIGRQRKQSLVYVPGVWVPAKVRVFAFSNLKDAISHRDRTAYLPTQIWRAMATDVQRPSLPLFLPSVRPIARLLRLSWIKRLHHIWGRIGFHYGGFVPAGTAVCSSIKLIERVG